MNWIVLISKKVDCYTFLASYTRKEGETCTHDVVTYRASDSDWINEDSQDTPLGSANSAVLECESQSTVCTACDQTSTSEKKKCVKYYLPTAPSASG